MAAVLEGLLLRDPRLPDRVAGRCVPLLTADLHFLPISNSLRGSLKAMASLALAPNYYDLLPEVEELARELSASGRVGYMNLEFHGGRGFHEAVGWEHGHVAWGPDFTANEPETDRFRQVGADDDWAINGLLRWLGATAEEGRDEFATAGLDRWRWTQEWANVGAATCWATSSGRRTCNESGSRPPTEGRALQARTTVTNRSRPVKSSTFRV